MGLMCVGEERKLIDARGGEIRELHVDNILQPMKKYLDKKVAELKAQRMEHDWVLKTHLKFKLAVRAASRERDTARAEATAAESHVKFREESYRPTRRIAEQGWSGG